MEGVDYAGWAFKQGSKVKNWKKRFFVLRGRELCYYASQHVNGKGVDEKGRVVVVGVDGSLAEAGGRDAMLLIACDRKVQPLKIKPLVPEETRMWLRKLQAAVAHFGIGGRDPYDEDDPYDDDHFVRSGGFGHESFHPADSVQAYYKVQQTPVIPRETFKDVLPERHLVTSSLAIDTDDEDNNQDDVEEHTSKRVKDNSRTLARRALATGSHISVAREGWLSIGNPKEPQSWKKRYAVLAGPTLTYYASKGSGQAIESVWIVGVSLSSSKSNALEVTLDGGRVLGIAADSRDELVSWEYVIASVLGSAALLRAASSMDDQQAEDEDANGARPSSYTGVFCEGWLQTKEKVAARPKDWERRYFILNGATLQQRDTPTSQVVHEGYVVNMTIRNQTSVAEFEVEFMSGRSLVLRTDNTKDTERWIHALSDLIGSPLLPPPSQYPQATTQIVQPVSALAAQVDLNPVSKSGWLLKEGYRIKSWKKRYFVLEGATLQYFEKMNDVPRGSGIVFRVVRNSSPTNSLDVHFLNGRILRISSESKIELDQWHTALRAASEFSGHVSVDSQDSKNVSKLPGKSNQHGWLMKRGQMMKTWKRRYFVLQRNRLMYYETIGGDLLGSGSVFDVSVGDQRPLCLDVRFQNGRLLHAVASDDEDFKQWLEALQNASNISESFMSQNSISQDDTVFDTEFEYDPMHERSNSYRDTGFGDFDNDQDEVGGYGTWADAMNNKPEWDRQSSWDSGLSDNNYGDADDENPDDDIPDYDNQRRGSDVSSVASQARGVSGWLRKEGANIKSWKKRYFTLHGVKLSYFKSASGSLLRSYEVSDVEELPSVKFGLAIMMTCGRRLVVAAESTEEYEKWLLALWGVIADERASLSHSNPSSEYSAAFASGKGSVAGKSAPTSPAAVPKDPKSHSGWLEKEGQVFKTWKKRYFTYKNSALIYYNDVGGVAQGHGVVTGVHIDNTKPNTLKVKLREDRIMRVTASTPEEMNTWLRVLSTSRSISEEPVASSDMDDIENDGHGMSRNSAHSAARGSGSDHNEPSTSAPGARPRPDPARFNADDYLANDTITNESFLRIRAENGGSELNLTGGSFYGNRTFKGDLTFSPTLPTPGEDLGRMDSDEDLAYLRVLTAEDDVAEAKRKQKEIEEGLVLPDRCACCIVM